VPFFDDESTISAKFEHFGDALPDFAKSLSWETRKGDSIIFDLSVFVLYTIPPAIRTTN
jgi:hypothetical protein